MQTKKSTWLLISSLIFSPILLAQPPCACDPTCSYENFYVGASVAAARLNSTLQIIAPKDSPAPFINDEVDLNASQILGGVTLGIGAGKGSWYFAVEANSFPVPFQTTVNWTGASGLTHESSLTMINIGNIDFIPAFHISPTVMLYLRGGAAFSWFQMEHTILGNEIKTNTFQPGVHLGLGFDWRITDHLSTGLDYTYSNFGKVEMTSTIKSGALLIPTQVDLKPVVNMIGLHLYYNFT